MTVRSVILCRISHAYCWHSQTHLVASHIFEEVLSPLFTSSCIRVIVPSSVKSWSWASLIQIVYLRDLGIALTSTRVDCGYLFWLECSLVFIFLIFLYLYHLFDKPQLSFWNTRSWYIRELRITYQYILYYNIRCTEANISIYRVPACQSHFITVSPCSFSFWSHLIESSTIAC